MDAAKLEAERVAALKARITSIREEIKVCFFDPENLKTRITAM